jgi:sodium/potassium-transporting ATPase subunit beta
MSRNLRINDGDYMIERMSMITQKRERFIIKKTLTFKEKIENYRKFAWNSETRQFFGRDGESWAKISLFYFCFYISLACFFAAILAIFMAIIDKRTPTYTSYSNAMSRQAIDGKIIGVSPGLGFRPQSDTQKTLIRIKSSSKLRESPYNFQQYVDLLDYFLSFYTTKDKFGEQIINCDDGSDLVYLEKQFSLNKICRFEIVEMFGPNNMCTKERNYEFDKSKPCILLKLNKIYDWKPEAYLPSDILPDQLKPFEATVRAFPRNVFVLCDGEFPVDKDFIGSIRYFSRTHDGSGESRLGLIPFYYFPFKNQDGYRSPLVFAYFQNITTNVLVNVMCRAFAKNVHRNDLYRMGSVHLEIMID